MGYLICFYHRQEAMSSLIVHLDGCCVRRSSRDQVNSSDKVAEVDVVYHDSLFMNKLTTNKQENNYAGDTGLIFCRD